jgi:hypothetical protein
LKALAKRGSPSFYKTTKNLHLTTGRSLAIVLSTENNYFISAVAKEEEEEEENLGAKRQNPASPKRGIFNGTIRRTELFETFSDWPTPKSRGSGGETMDDSLRSCVGRTRHDIGCTQVFPAASFMSLRTLWCLNFTSDCSCVS